MSIKESGKISLENVFEKCNYSGVRSQNSVLKKCKQAALDLLIAQGIT